MQLNRFMIRPHVEQALRDEIGPGDTTGGFLVGDDPVQTAQIYAKGSGIVCGLLLADETIRTVDPDARIVPYMLSGGTDAKAFARLGIRCFGFAPLQLPPDLDFTALFHGVDERVPVDALKFGTQVLEHFLLHC